MIQTKIKNVSPITCGHLKMCGADGAMFGDSEEQVAIARRAAKDTGWSFPHVMTDRRPTPHE
jgi:hypothetical protein